MPKSIYSLDSGSHTPPESKRDTAFEQERMSLVDYLVESLVDSADD